MDGFKFSCKDCRCWDDQVEMSYMDEQLGKGFCEKFELFSEWDYRCVMMEAFPENLVRKESVDDFI